MNIKEAREKLKGMAIKDARVLVAEDNFIIRIIIEDGKELICTSDLRSDRINVYVNKGIISSVENIG